MDRRQFLKLGAFSAFATTGLGALLARAAGGDYRAAVCVFLNGGCDSNNLIVANDDAGYAAYADARRSLAIPRARLLPVTTASGAAYGLHPNMPELQGLFNQARLAVVANVGTLMRPTTAADVKAGTAALPDNLLSHIDQQNQWMMLNPGAPEILTGWGGRMADALQTANASARFPSVVSTAGSNLFCDAVNATSTVIDAGGSTGVAGATGFLSGNARQAAINQILSDGSGPQLQAAYAGMVSAAMSQVETVNGIYGVPISTAFPQTDIGQQLHRVAQMIASRGSLGLARQVFYIEHGGYDTHANQTATLQTLFAELSQALAAFNTSMIELGVDQNVIAFTHSEFSRTFKPAGDNGDGSDHAWGGHSLVLGGAVKGGNVYGTFPQLLLAGVDDASDEGRWTPTTSVDQYAATIASWMGVADADLRTVFPNLANFQQTRVGFL